MTYLEWIRQNAESPPAIAVAVAFLAVEMQSESMYMLTGKKYPEQMKQISMRTTLPKVVALLNREIAGGLNETDKN